MLTRLTPLLLIGASLGAQTLPEPATRELKYLAETYHTLDFAAPRIWNGWTSYRRPPFLFEFSNGLRVLVGHPAPPKPFQPVAGAAVDGRPVFADWSSVSAAPLAWPASLGGGLMILGADSAGKPVQVVGLQVRTVQHIPEARSVTGDAEEHILVMVHELFHCFQHERLNIPLYGNLQYNPDLNYAIYAEIEGLALRRAFLEPDAERARAHLREFLAARRKKHTSMTADQIKQEGWEEFNEGTATYSELRTLELMKAGGFQPALRDDPWYHGFSNAGALLDRFPERLQQSAGRTEDSTIKFYDYGCFQAILLERLFPGWQSAFPKPAEFLDSELARRLAVADSEWPGLESGLDSAYGVADIRARHAPVIAARDDAWRTIRARSGRVYVVDCKPVKEALTHMPAHGKYQRLGMATLYPLGFDAYRFNEVEIGATTTPASSEQLFYLRAVDTQPRAGAAPYTIEGARQPDGSWKQAVVQTPLFTLKAPHLRIVEAGNLIKFRVLARTSR